MVTSPNPGGGGISRSHILSSARLISFVGLLAFLAALIALSWFTRGAVADLAVLRAHGRGGASLVDLRPWETAQTLASLAVTSEENEYAREAERLADHEVDQAFAAALRQAELQRQSRVLTGRALSLSQRITELQQEMKQDRAAVDVLKTKAAAQSTGSGAAAASAPASAALQVAQAQLGLDSDELTDAQHDLDRATNNQSVRIQEELAAHEASMRKYDSEQKYGGQIAVVSVRAHRTLAARIRAWFDQRSRYDSVQQALADTQRDVSRLTSEHNALEGQADAAASAAANAPVTLSELRKRSMVREILSIDDDRIQTDQQLATVYQKWGDQILLQHRIVMHLILSSLEMIVIIVLGMILGDAAVRRLMTHPSLDRRQTEILRTILEVSVQVLGVLLIYLVIFGPPRQTATMIGLATAALTISLQDYIIAFIGWFMLVGKNGIRVGDIVEINGVCGEVAEIGLMTTTLLETTGLADKGEPTGRRISFLNSFAIRGVYFNFSSKGQWLWDEITVTVPVTEDVYSIAKRIEAAARQETEEASRLAEEEWKHSRRTTRLARQSAAPAIMLRPSGGSIDIQVRYVANAASRSEVRDRLYRQVIGLFQKPGQSPQPEAIAEIACEPAGSQV